jgi:hypothetical protein
LGDRSKVVTKALLSAIVIVELFIRADTDAKSAIPMTLQGMTTPKAVEKQNDG